MISLPAITLENDPLGRIAGEALWSEAYPLPVLEETKATLGSRDWDALYQQCPLTESDVIFSPKTLQFYMPKKYEFDQIIHSWDLSFGGTGAGNSWVVGQVWGLTGKHKYLLHMTREQMGFSDSLAAIRALNNRLLAKVKLKFDLSIDEAHNYKWKLSN